VPKVQCGTLATNASTRPADTTTTHGKTFCIQGETMVGAKSRIQTIRHDTTICRDFLAKRPLSAVPNEASSTHTP
jgi:hypothetical protein